VKEEELKGEIVEKVKEEELKGEIVEKVKEEESKGEKDDEKQPAEQPPLSPSLQQEEKDESKRKDAAVHEEEENTQKDGNESLPRQNRKWHQSMLIDVMGETDDVHLTGLEFHLGITPEIIATSCSNCSNSSNSSSSPSSPNLPSSSSMSNFLHRMRSRTSKLVGKKTMMLANRRVVDRDRLIEARFLSKIYNIGNVDSYQWRADLEREAYRIYMDWISQEGVEWSDKVNCQLFTSKIYEAFTGKKMDSTSDLPQQVLEPAKDDVLETARPLKGESSPDNTFQSSPLQPQIQASDKPVEIIP